jgi:hypothetical protein
LKKNELNALSIFLDNLKESQCSNGANPWKLPNDWSQEEKNNFAKEVYEHHGQLDEFDPTYDYMAVIDYKAVNFLQNKITSVAKLASE